MVTPKALSPRRCRHAFIPRAGRTLGLLAWAGLWIAAAFPARGEEALPPVPLFRFESSLLTDYHHDHDLGSGAKDDYLKVSNQTHLSMDFAGFFLSARLETTLYPDPLVWTRASRSTSAPTSSRMSEDDFRVEKYVFGYESAAFRADLGDYYATLGRGLALSVRREGEGMIDTSLRGAKLEWRVGSMQALLLAGFTNTLNINPVDENPQSDPNDFVAAIHLGQGFGEQTRIGLHAAQFRYGFTRSASVRRYLPDDQSHILGGSLELTDLFGHVSFYAEGNYLRRSGRELGENPWETVKKTDSGLGVYASLNTVIENFSFTAEMKVYRDFLLRRVRAPLGIAPRPGEKPRPVPDGLTFSEDVVYNRVPTLERDDLDLNRTYGNDQGFRLRAEYLFESTSTQPYAVYLFSINKGEFEGVSSLGGLGALNGHHKGDRIDHVYGGVIQRFGEAELTFDLGFRNETDRDEGKEYVEMIHGKVSATIPIAGRHLLNVEVLYLRQDYQYAKHLEDIVDWTVGYTLSRVFSAAFFWTLRREDFLPGAGKDATRHFLAGELTTRFSDDLEFSIFGGQVRDATRCYGGFCRRIPAYEGVRGRVTVRF